MNHPKITEPSFDALGIKPEVFSDKTRRLAEKVNTLVHKFISDNGFHSDECCRQMVLNALSVITAEQCFRLEFNVLQKENRVMLITPDVVGGIVRHRGHLCDQSGMPDFIARLNVEVTEEPIDLSEGLDIDAESDEVH